MKVLYISLLIGDLHSAKVLVQKRQTQDEFHGFYELIGGKIESNETSKEALIREAYEEQGLKLDEDKCHLFLQSVYHYPEKTIHFFSYLYEFSTSLPSKNEFLIWLELSQALEMVESFPPATVEILKELAKYLKR